MRTIISAAISSDGYMDDTTPERLVLSDDADWNEVHRLRAKYDAILVGAETVRRDNPSLVLRDEKLRMERTAKGKTPDIIKVVVSGCGNLSPDMRFFTEGATSSKIVITTDRAPADTILTLSRSATVIILPEITAKNITEALARENIESLMIEGGARTINMFIDEEMVDEMRLAVSPVTVNDSNAPRLPYFGNLPFACRALKTTRKVGKMTVHEYVIHPEISNDDLCHIQRAIEISRLSKPCDTAYRVGCVIKCASGRLYEGYTHETDPHNHAEEEAIAKALAVGEELHEAVIYTSMEPCSTRCSKPVSCSELIIRHGMARVFYAYAEPDCFVCCDATRRLREAGIEVFQATQLSPEVIEINAHIIDR